MNRKYIKFISFLLLNNEDSHYQQRGDKDKMLSKDCDGCELQLFECKRRFQLAHKGDKTYCPDGTAHLIDC